MSPDEAWFRTVVVATAVAGLAALGWVGTQLEGVLRVGAWLLFDFVVLGGGHLYLAVRGEGGSVPVRSRWRYVAALSVVFGVAPLVAFGVDVWFPAIDGAAVGVVLAASALFASLVAEAASGYRESRPQ